MYRAWEIPLLWCHLSLRQGMRPWAQTRQIPGPSIERDGEGQKSRSGLSFTMAKGKTLWIYLWAQHRLHNPVSCKSFVNLGGLQPPLRKKCTMWLYLYSELVFPEFIGDTFSEWLIIEFLLKQARLYEFYLHILSPTPWVAFWYIFSI